jgi:PAS domain S-box-containing protein
MWPRRHKLATVFTQSAEGIYTVDGDLRIGGANPAMADLLGLPVTALEGRPCAAVCHFEDAAGERLCPGRCPLRLAWTERRPVTQEVIYQHPEQFPRTLLLTYAAAGDAQGRLELGIGILRDISGQKEAERLRDEFVSLVTHELRSPLTISLGYWTVKRSSALARRATQCGALRYFVSRIEGAERPLRLVNNLLEIGRVEGPSFEPEYDQFDLARC